jgi:hypothetical protein
MQFRPLWSKALMARFFNSFLQNLEKDKLDLVLFQKIESRIRKFCVF